MDEHNAAVIVNSLHAAWSTRDLDRLLEYYCEDLSYTCNVEPAGCPVRIDGKVEFRRFLQQILDATESVSVVESFHFDGQSARATVACYVKHSKTGIVLSGSYRQVFRMRGGKVLHLEEYHDAARLNAFWRLVELCEKEASGSQRKA